jgi:hypothetical protein
MTVTLIVLLVVLFLALLFIPFMRQIAKDKVELSQTTLPQKFETLFATINAGLMGGNGELTTFDDEPRLVNMMDHSHPNMLIQFYYSTANLSITLNSSSFRKSWFGKRTILAFGISPYFNKRILLMTLHLSPPKESENINKM